MLKAEQEIRTDDNRPAGIPGDGAQQGATVRERDLERELSEARHAACTLRNVLGLAMEALGAERQDRLSARMEGTAVVRRDHVVAGHAARTAAERLAEAVAHDLNGPLATLGNYARLMAERYEGLVDRAGERHLGYILESARMFEQVHDALCDFVEHRSGAGTREPVALEHSLRDALRALSDRIEARGVRVTHENLPTVEAVPGSMAALFEQLVWHVASHNVARAPHVRVSGQPGPVAWQVTVEEVLEAEPAPGECRLDLSRCLSMNGKQPAGGVSMELARKIVEQHGGEIWLASHPGEGRRIVFTMPVYRSGREGFAA